MNTLPDLRTLLQLPESSLPAEGPFCKKSAGEWVRCKHRSCFRIAAFAPLIERCTQNPVHGLQVAVKWTQFETAALGTWFYMDLECGCWLIIEEK